MHTDVQRLLVAVLGDPLSLTRLTERDLDLALRTLRRVRLLGHVAAQLQSHGLLESLPLLVQDQLHSSLVAARARARVARWELNRIDLALSRDPSEPAPAVVVMKGCAYLLLGLPQATGRMFADVDLLVAERALPGIEGLLSRGGWRAKELTAYDQRYYRVWTHEIPPLTHDEREVEVDLHHSILMRTARMKPDPQLLLAASRPLPDSRFRVLAPVDMALHAMTHLFYGGEMDDSLRELVDIDQLLRHFGAEQADFWALFLPRARQLDLMPAAFYGLHFAQRLLGTPVPDATLADARVAAPPAMILGWMNRLVPLTLFPQHPDALRRSVALARLLLFVRAHWVRMPPLLLLRHLSYKFYLRFADRKDARA